MDKTLDIRYAEEKDLLFVDYLQKKNARDLSFFPKSVLEREIKSKSILLALINNQHAGYLFHGSIKRPRDGILKIHQACIEYDLRGNWYGAALIQMLEDLGNLSSAQGISLRCGSDIDANSFWKLMGFICIDIQPGGVRRMRDINVWFKRLTAEEQLSLFSFGEKVAIEPSTKKRDSSFWRKRKKGKSSNIMLRGQALLDYRKSVLEESND